MKKISMVLAIAGLSAAGLMSACSSSSTEAKPTKGEECATGLSTECLIGEWHVNGLANQTDGSMHATYNYTLTPGSLTFMEDGTFKYVVPASTPAGANCGENTYGNWSVSGGTLTMKTTIGDLCMASKSFSGSPVVIVNETTVKMNLNAMYFLANISDDKNDVAGYTEVFSISAQ